MQSLAKVILENANKFYDELDKNRNHRSCSWEHCYSAFYDVIKNERVQDYDYLALHLAFYLASWGMYRGSSFLLQYDYKVHVVPIKEYLLDNKDLFGIEWSKLDEDELKEKLNLLEDLSNKLKEYYEKLRVAISDKDIKTEVSDILITKILLGSLGCVPAYDSFFKVAARKYNVTTGIYNTKSINKLVEFYKNNENDLEETRKHLIIKNTDIKYPQMKLLDMALWELGQE